MATIQYCRRFGARSFPVSHGGPGGRNAGGGLGDRRFINSEKFSRKFAEKLKSIFSKLAGKLAPHFREIIF